MIGCTPPCYRALVVRLQTFDALAVAGESVKVVMWWDSDLRGQYYRRAVSILGFESYRAAQAYVRNGPGKGLTTVSFDPYKSCVPSEALEDYRLVRDG